MLLNLVAVNTPEKSHMIFNILGSTNINDQLCKQFNSVDIEYCQFSRSLRFNVELLWTNKEIFRRVLDIYYRVGLARSKVWQNYRVNLIG